MLIRNIKEFLKLTIDKKLISLDLGKKKIGIAISDSKHIITSKTLRSSVVSILYTKGFSVLFTNSIQDSANWILHFAEKIYKNGYDNTRSFKKSDISKNIKFRKVCNTKKTVYSRTGF